MYVWVDALTNYITGVGFPDERDANWHYWPADLHIIGKEISRFHCVYWPAFLMAAGLPLPKQIVAHGWLLFEQSKMSKSRGNIVRAETIVDVLGADALRYFLLREIVFGQDGSFSFDALVQRYNSDLANGYGNLASRTLAMIEKYFDGIVPETNADFLVVFPDRAYQDEHTTTDIRVETSSIVKLSGSTAELADEAFTSSEFNLSKSLEWIWNQVRATDVYISSNVPWKVAAEDDPLSRKRLAEILYTAAESLRIVTALLNPFLPDSTARIWAQLGLGDISKADLKNISWGQLQPGTKLGALGPVFPRADKETIARMQQMEDDNNAKRAVANEEVPKVAESGDIAPHPFDKLRAGSIRR
jgi:methionyl-tRNA synthetase